jgi:hypothetical protein
MEIVTILERPGPALVHNAVSSNITLLEDLFASLCMSFIATHVVRHALPMHLALLTSRKRAS